MEKPTHIFGYEIDWVGLEQIGWNDFVEYCDFNGIGSDPEDYEAWLDCWVSSRRAMYNNLNYSYHKYNAEEQAKHDDKEEGK